MSPRPIIKKDQFYREFDNGAFGNKLRSWPSVDAFFHASNQVFPVGLRYSGIGAQYPLYSKNLYDEAEVKRLAKRWVDLGADQNLIVVSETSNDELLTIQGELVQCDWCGYALFYSTARTRMREALKSSSRHHEGPGALLILQGLMTPSSYADLEVLLDQYPGHVIEFSTFSQCLGCIPGRNTIIWEVRLY